jgi:ribosomal protein L11 methyltransferase
MQAGPMSWLELSVLVARRHVALVDDLLQNEPVLALTYSEPAAEEPVLEPAVGDTPLWPSVRVTALLPGDTLPAPLCNLLSLLPGVDRAEQVSFRRVEDQAWERAWLERFEPMRFGKELWVVPGGMEAPAAGHIVKLDPGLAFGTGTHPTTRLCLEWIDGQDLEGRTVVDYGCGSGVLGIAAAVKGARRVICVDHDPQALTATRGNAEDNGVSQRVVALGADEFTRASADVVLANILAAPLIELAPVLLRALSANGRLVLSGILEAQADEVIDAYQHGLTKIERNSRDGWVCLHGRAREMSG